MERNKKKEEWTA
jgi:hypothetical protein